MLEVFNVPYIISNYGYIGIFVIVFLESGIFFALPGDSLLFSAGMIATTGYLNIFYLIPIIFISTFFGGILGYYVGMYIERLRRFKLFRQILKKEYIDNSHDFFEKHGHIAVVLARFVPIARTFVPIVAGISGMNIFKYLRYNFYGSLVWSFGVTLIGYFLGYIFPNLKDHLHWLIVLTILISCLPLLGVLKRKLRSRSVKTK